MHPCILCTENQNGYNLHAIFLIQRKESYIFEKKYVFGTRTCGLGGNGRNLLKKNAKLHLQNIVKFVR